MSDHARFVTLYCIADPPITHWSFPRAKMLVGGDATEQCVIIDGVTFLNNADVDGKATPPPGAPNIMMAAGRDISNRLGASPEHGIDMKLLMSDKSMDRDEDPAKKKPAAKKPAAKKPPAKKTPAAMKVLAPA